MHGRRRRTSLVGPVILIGLGVVFLLNNLGMLDWSVWDVLRLWPVLLVAAGLDLLIGRRSVWGSLVSVVLTLALVLGAVWLFSSETGDSQGAVEEIVQELGGAERARVDVAPAVGSLQIEMLAQSDSLVEGRIQLGSGERVVRDYQVQDGEATFRLESGEAAYVPFAGGWGGEHGWQLGLNPDVSLDLDVSMGAGEIDLDLTGATLEDVKVEQGVGEIRVVLPDEGQFEAQVSGAIGNIVVVIPEGLAARVRTETALAATSVPSGYERRGDVYASSDYEEADDCVDLEVEIAIGNVTIRHADG